MNNSSVIRDVGLTIANVLNLGLKAHKVKASVHMAPPQRAVFEKRAPAVGLTMLGLDALGFDGERPQEELVQEPQSDGSIKEFMLDPPMRLMLEYMVTGWGKEIEEDATLLGVAMKVLLECPVFEKEHIVGDSFTAEDRVPLQSLQNMPLEKRIALLQGFGEPIRGAAFYQVPVLLFSERRSPEVRRVISRHFGVIDKQTGRRLR